MIAIESVKILKHELRNQLGVLQVQLQVARLLAQQANAQQVLKPLNIANGVAAQMATLLDAADLTVNAGDLEPGHLAPEPTLDLLPLTLAPFIAAQVAALQPVALQQGLNLKYTCRLSPEAVDALTVRVDRTALAQVILNLVKNAFEACKAKAEDDTPLQALPEPAEQNKAEPDLPDVQPDVYLLLEQHGAFVRLTIQDTGCGADAGLQKKMCSPGFTSKVSGSGIGLWHSQRLVQAMGGRLQFESPGRGKGATVTLQLPVFVSY